MRTDAHLRLYPNVSPALVVTWAYKTMLFSTLERYTATS
ncbi:hypothetical protein OU5_6006 [Pseudomonas mandelii JR-1]|uniref:Uncharacterized protein n=1 Tax=Pseudomonas mandelii JR-1 TaxID=1147786 RepID=A0A024EKH3_9PSED|nr:hypothetical protein OU5_6006 [Pseudomonas mandelii JR-1]